jgi:1-acyl-sn-glycerol-3-phosphate acyltransferase
VVVANHSSHADTAALLAALPPASRPVFAAAADYWFDVPVRRAAASGLAGILPVRRGEHGAYAALLAAARPALAAGRTVVVYPEGTRSTDGQVGEFHSGAVRLAADCGVALVPVAVLGTRDVLPKHGRLRPAPMDVRIGAPRAPEATDAARLRSDVLALLDRGQAHRRVSAGWARVARLVGEQPGQAAAGGAGVRRVAVGQVFEGGAAGEERDAATERRPAAAVGVQRRVEERRAEVAVEPGEIEGGIGDGGVGPIDHARQPSFDREQVLGAEVGMGEDLLGGSRRRCRAHDA